eukprot:9476760-Pyramimonas_sp.AAC.3
MLRESQQIRQNYAPLTTSEKPCTHSYGKPVIGGDSVISGVIRFQATVIYRVYIAWEYLRSIYVQICKQPMILIRQVCLNVHLGVESADFALRATGSKRNISHALMCCILWWHAEHFAAI